MAGIAFPDRMILLPSHDLSTCTPIEHRHYEDSRGATICLNVYCAAVGNLLDTCFQDQDNYQIFRLHFDQYRIYRDEVPSGEVINTWRDLSAWGNGTGGPPPVMHLSVESLWGNDYLDRAELSNLFASKDWNSIYYYPFDDVSLPAEECVERGLSHPGMLIAGLDQIDFEISETEMLLRPAPAPRVMRVM